MSESLYMRGLVAVSAVLALFLVIIGVGSIANGIFGSTEDVGSGWVVHSRLSPGLP